MINTEVCIVGSGPGGAMTALRLGKDGIPFVIIDKQTFPRDKICGDGLTGKVPTIMKRISPELFDRFVEECNPLPTAGARFVTPGDYQFDIPYHKEGESENNHSKGCTLPRKEFDAFLLNEVSNIDVGTVITGEEVKAVKRTKSGFLIETAHQQINARICIDAGGTASRFTHDYVKPKPKTNKTALAVRTYYEGVVECDNKNFLEIFFIEGSAGYFWIFPLPNGMANVGVGGRKDLILKQKVVMSKLMENVIKTHPTIAPRFTNAKQIGKLAAYKIPLAKPSFNISGDHYMLIGDAAQLVDPVTGEGVGNAFYSGFIAAEQAISCLKNERFDKKFMLAYDKRIEKVVGMELSVGSAFSHLIDYPMVFKWLAKKTHKNKHLSKLLPTLIVDVNNIKKLLNPIYLFRVFLNI